MSAVDVLSPDHPLRFPYRSPSVARNYYDDEVELISADSTPFASAPSSPSRYKARDLFYSVPPSPSRGFESLESFYGSNTLQVSALFNCDGFPPSPNGGSSALNSDCLLSPSGLQHLSARTMGFELIDDRKAQLSLSSGGQEGSQEAVKGFDSDFKFSSSEFENGTFGQMSSADELFSKGKILPLMQPHRQQKQSQEFAMLDSGARFSSVSAPSSPSNERVSRGDGSARPRSGLGLKYSSNAEAKNLHEQSSRQGWAKTLAKTMIFRKTQKIKTTTPSSPSQTRKRTDFSKNKDGYVALSAVRTDDASSHIPNSKDSSNHASGRDGPQQSAHQKSVVAGLHDMSEPTSVKKWYDKDGDKRMKNGAARSWPRPSARSALTTRSSRDCDPSKRGSLAAPLEMHYRHNAATSEQMRKRTFLPYKESLLGCIGLGGMWVPGLSTAFDSVGR